VPVAIAVGISSLVLTLITAIRGLPNVRRSAIWIAVILAAIPWVATPTIMIPIQERLAAAGPASGLIKQLLWRDIFCDRCRRHSIDNSSWGCIKVGSAKLNLVHLGRMSFGFLIFRVDEDESSASLLSWSLLYAGLQRFNLALYLATYSGMKM
jgi:hypothetical protein